MKKLTPTKLLLFIFLALLIISLTFESVFSLLGADWFSKQFYWLRCLEDTSVQGIVICFAFIQYKKLIANYKSHREKMKSFKIAEFFIAILTILAIAFEILLKNWIEPGHYGDVINIYLASGMLLTVLFLLEQLKLNPEEGKKKRTMITLLILSVLGAIFVGTVILSWMDVLKRV